MEAEFFGGVVSVGAVGALAALVTQLVKAVTKRVAWLPRLQGSASATVAYVVALALMGLLALAGYTPDRQDALIDAVLTVVMGLGAGALGQGAYTVVRDVRQGIVEADDAGTD